MAKYRVVSIDGGGIRGIVPAVILQKIIQTPGLENFLDTIDLIAGTSTGGLLALGIANQQEPSVIRDLYIDKGPKIFEDSWFDNLIHLGRILGADYDTKNLRLALEGLFGDKTLGELSKRVLITSFDLDNEVPDDRKWKPKLFHNFPGENNDRESRVVDVGLYTSAAPTYFPSVDGYIDGGVFANNPAMCALAQTQDTRYDPTPALDDVLLFSLGTGLNRKYIEGKTKDWGYVQWVKPLLSIMLEGTAGIADYQCHQMLREQYRRVEPIFPAGTTIPLDDVSQIPYLIEFTETWPLDQTIDWLRQTWNA